MPLAYKLLRAYVPSMSEVMALGLGALFPATKGIVLWRQRRLDFIGVIVLIGIAVGMVVLLVGRSLRAFLMRESFVMGSLRSLALSSFAWQRPLLFYVVRQFAAGRDPVWSRPFQRNCGSGQKREGSSGC